MLLTFGNGSIAYGIALPLKHFAWNCLIQGEIHKIKLNIAKRPDDSGQYYEVICSKFVSFSLLRKSFILFFSSYTPL